MVRSAFGVVVGAVAWMIAFFTLARLLFFVWADYAFHARAWTATQSYDFTAPESAFNAMFWLLAAIFAGWLAVVIAKRREAAWALGAVIGLYLAYVHLYSAWDNFPWWYNLVVALPAAPAVILGGRLAGRLSARHTTAAA